MKTLVCSGLVGVALALSACSSEEAEPADAPETAPEAAPAEPAAEAAPEEAAEAEADSGWRLVWSDEFDGDAIDPERWSHEIDCWGGGNEERQCYTDSENNSRIEDGMLVIEARLEETTGPALPPRLLVGADEEARNAQATQPFSSARIVTNGHADWRYGRIEVRAKLPVGQGTWPAIWMLPTDEYYGPWAASGEIDILEVVNLGEPCEACPGGLENTVLGTLHFGGVWPENAYANRRTHLPDTESGEQEFHVFAIEWTEGQVEWFLNGESYGSLTPDDWSTSSELGDNNPNAPFDRPFFLILNLAVGGHLAESHNEGGVDESVFPQTFTVDWVRVYDCPSDPETMTGCKG
jgi:beta-glucanase (GH16 family)